MASLILSRLAFEGRHGATERERRTLRTFEVDVEIETSLDKAAGSDALADTIDYREVSEIVVGLGTSETHHLLESLARRMLDALADRFPGAAFRIELRKLNPPACPGHPAYAGVRMSRPTGGWGRTTEDAEEGENAKPRGGEVPRS
ncbi:MAG: dihydroneopterin aldolase [Deltaproteobacteria bacterium]|nr:dihydroneopterin aldolase [Deltaproteobacteria bacterium]